jgi:hypothetical protein
MRRWFVLACVIGGCWHREPRVAPSPPSDQAPEPRRRVSPHFFERGYDYEALDPLREFRDRMCDCSDRACADAVTADITRWSQGPRPEPPSDPGLLEEMNQDIALISHQFSECRTAAMSAGANP